MEQMVVFHRKSWRTRLLGSIWRLLVVRRMVIWPWPSPSVCPRLRKKMLGISALTFHISPPDSVTPPRPGRPGHRRATRPYSRGATILKHFLFQQPCFLISKAMMYTSNRHVFYFKKAWLISKYVLISNSPGRFIKQCMHVIKLKNHWIAIKTC